MGKKFLRRLRVESLENRRVFTGPVDMEPIVDEAPAVVELLSSTARAIEVEGGEVEGGDVKGEAGDVRLQMGPEVYMDALDFDGYWVFSGQVVNPGSITEVTLGGALSGTAELDEFGFFEVQSTIQVGSGLGTATATVPGGNVAEAFFE